MFLESIAPLNLQEDYDNSGLQVGFPTSDINKVLVCLDVTEEVVDEAIRLGCELIVSHHPLLFRSLKTVSDATYQQRCVVKAIKAGIAIYSAHTNLDNAAKGVNYKIASILGLSELRPLVPNEDGISGSGIIGTYSTAIPVSDFLSLIKEKFGVENLRYTLGNKELIQTVAICGGSGASFLPNAIASAADCFISGEFGYHDYFENQGLTLAELGHYQSEKFTIDLLYDLLATEFSNKLEVIKTSINTNPILYK